MKCKSNQHAAHFRLTQCCMSIMTQQSWEENKKHCKRFKNKIHHYFLGRVYPMQSLGHNENCSSAQISENLHVKE